MESSPPFTLGRTSYEGHSLRMLKGIAVALNKRVQVRFAAC